MEAEIQGHWHQDGTWVLKGTWGVEGELEV